MIRYIIFILFLPLLCFAQTTPKDYTWTSPSMDSSQSMPCGGGSIGMNVLVENGDIYFYVSRSGAFDENNTLLKQGRFRLHLTPSLDFDNFEQSLKLNDGYISITDGLKTINLWCDVFKPIVHVDIQSKEKVTLSASYENWRTKDRYIDKNESFQTSYKFGVPVGTVTHCDNIEAKDNEILFWHQNKPNTVFDSTVNQQKLSSVKSYMDNPLSELIFGGKMTGDGFIYKETYNSTYNEIPFTGWIYMNKIPKKNLSLNIILDNHKGSLEQWKENLCKTEKSINIIKDIKASRKWWNDFWQRSFIVGGDQCREYTDNYTLFRYMMGCNAYGEWPTKFNGGLFCFDPVHVGKEFSFTPDYRRWGGGTHTAQNQRLLYWPMLKSGDYDMMKPQLDFYKYICKNAELRSKVYWQHDGACFTEQIENFGLPEFDEYGKKRPAELEPGIQYNVWLEYTWDTVLEFCQMALDREDYSGISSEEYIPFICSSLDFFDNHYRYLAKRRGIKETDDSGKLILYPGSGAETFKMAYNSTSTCCGLRVVTEHLIKWMEKHGKDQAMIVKYKKFLTSIPDLTYREISGHKVISPAVIWTRINGSEATQLYPVYPWRVFGVGRKNIDVALNTWKYDPFVEKNQGYESWEQSNIWAACLGQTNDAVKWLRHKLKNGPHRFPAFWGPGHDWTPDHNWGGSGMIGLQEMLMQEVDDGKILLFPAWPKEWNVHFRLNASRNTIVDVVLENGEIKNLKVIPEKRLKDIKIMYQTKM